jgi:hypothetical protein
MQRRPSVSRAAALVVAFAAALVVSGGATALASSSGAQAAPSIVYVSHGAHACGQPRFRSINAGVQAVAPGGTVVVCSGRYNEDVVVTKRVSLVGHDAYVNPSQPVLQKNSPLFDQVGNNGFTIMAPNVGVRGFQVSHATGDGILSIRNHSTIVNNGSFLNKATGISLNGSSWSLVAGNVSNRNKAGGITLANDAGAIIPGATASHDRILNNTAANNPKGCGVILADHLGSTVDGARGIFANLIRGNTLKHNGDAGFGGGVLFASPVPGGVVRNNVVTYNVIDGSGLGGITLHSHIAGQNLSGNVVARNSIGTNNVLGDYADTETTGIYVGSVDPVTITVRGNLIHDNHYGIFTAGKVKVNGAMRNAFVNVAEKRGSTAVYGG